MPKDLYEIGEIPPLGEVPARMYAQVIRPDRFGEPRDAFEVEDIEVPDIGPHDAVVLVMAAGINYNNVWAALGIPVDVTRVHGKFGEPSDFHIGGSDASGIVYAVGDEVENVAVGDHVVIHCGQWDVEDDEIREGLDPGFHDSYRIWGYETNWGSFAQFTKVQAHQCLPKAPQLTWEQAAADPGRRYGVPDAHGVAPEHRAGGRRRADLGRGRRARFDGRPDREGDGRQAGGRGVERGQGGVLHQARCGRRDQPPLLRPLGDAPALEGHRGLRGVVRRGQGVRQGLLGRAGGEKRAEARVRVPRR